MNVLVAVGASYIGLYMVKALPRAGHGVAAFDNLAAGHADAVRDYAHLSDLCDAHLLALHRLTEGKAQKVIGWSPKCANLPDIVRSAWIWMLAQARA
jgi:UDP-glucose 4-epimerase